MARYEDNRDIPRMMDYLEVIYEEITLWKYLNNKNIAKLYHILDAIDDPDEDKIYLIMQLCDLG